MANDWSRQIASELEHAVERFLTLHNARMMEGRSSFDGGHDTYRTENGFRSTMAEDYMVRMDKGEVVSIGPIEAQKAVIFGYALAEEKIPVSQKNYATKDSGGDEEVAFLDLKLEPNAANLNKVQALRYEMDQKIVDNAVEQIKDILKPVNRSHRGIVLAGAIDETPGLTIQQVQDAVSRQQESRRRLGEL